MSRSQSFTLIEIIIVITILGMLATLASTNFVGSLKKGRDGKRKMDLASIQRGLEMYYEDEKRFPASISFGGKLCKTPPSCTGETIYMQIIPNDPSPGKTYFYETNTGGTYYKLYSTIENPSGTEPVYSLNCGGGSIPCNYGATSTNTILTIPIVVIANEGTNNSCDGICGLDGKLCLSVGTNTSGSDGSRGAWSSGHCGTYPSTTCATIMTNNKTHICVGRPANWTNCRCQ